MEDKTKVVPEETSEGFAEKTTTDYVASEDDDEAEIKITENRCPNCQALLTDGQLFCPECGVPIKKLCQRCGAEIKEGQSFCPNCGQDVGSLVMNNTNEISDYNNNLIRQAKKKNKVRTIIIISCVVLAIASVISYLAYQNHKVKEYKETVSLFCSTVLNSAGNLEDIGNEIKTEWYNYIWNSRYSKYYSIDSAVAGALSNKAKEVSTAKSDKILIDSYYNIIKNPVNNSDEIRDLCEAAKNLYSEYESMYNCVITPSGTYMDFNNRFSNCDTNTLNAYKKLNELCEN